jgi:hypothetical protein
MRWNRLRDLEGGGDFVTPPGNKKPLPHWYYLLFGRLLLRMCRGRKKDCCNETCVLRPYCECSLAHDEASRRLETRLLVFVVLCAVMVMAWAFL